MAPGKDDEPESKRSNLTPSKPDEVATRTTFQSIKFPPSVNARTAVKTAVGSARLCTAARVDAGEPTRLARQPSRCIFDTLGEFGAIGTIEFKAFNQP